VAPVGCTVISSDSVDAARILGSTLARARARPPRPRHEIEFPKW